MGNAMSSDEVAIIASFDVGLSLVVSYGMAPTISAVGT